MSSSYYSSLKSSSSSSSRENHHRDRRSSSSRRNDPSTNNYTNIMPKYENPIPIGSWQFPESLEHFEKALRDLTFPSRPIIGNLTTLTKEYLNRDHSVGGPLSYLILDYFCNVPLERSKLPALFLIDSIAKNIGQPFINYWEDDNLLVRCFSYVFQNITSTSMKTNFIKTLNTWWSSTPSSSLFSPELTNTLLERHDPSHRSKTPLELEIDLQQLKEESCKVGRHYNGSLVSQIMEAIEMKCLQKSCSQIFNDLDHYARMVDKRNLIEYIDHLLENVSHGDSSPPSIIDIKQQQQQQQQQPLLPQQPPLPPPLQGDQLGNLLKSLSTTLPGLLNSINTSPLMSTFEQQKQYNPLITNEMVLQRSKTAHHIIYQQCLPKQCPNCGKRYPLNDGGKLSLHIDLHFKKNQRNKERSRRMVMHQWLLSEADWMATSDLNSSDNNDLKRRFPDEEMMMPFGNLNSSKQIKTEEKLRIAVGKNDLKGTKCPICHEKIDVMWDDESEEWVFKNAVLDGKDIPCHSICL